MSKLYNIKNFIINNNKDGVSHLAVIMDGNGRWAQLHGMPRWKGHEMGVRAVKRLVDSASRYRIPVVTVFAFSSENWKRPEREVRLLFDLFCRYFSAERKNLLKKNVRISVFGRRDRIPKRVLEAIEIVEEETRQNTRLHLRIALDYGARHEIIETVRMLVRQGIEHKIKPEQISEELFSDSLSSAGIGDPDLIIRTAGEQRLSNFLLWQSAYSELYFCPKFWPDFDKDDLEKALKNYRLRTRRFGGLVSTAGSVRSSPFVYSEPFVMEHTMDSSTVVQGEELK
jgi:undecaprenyl diphosphate synthase